MGATQSTTQVVNKVNEFITTAIIQRTNECAGTFDLGQEQSVQCTLTETKDSEGNNIYYEEQNGCRRCINHAFRYMRHQMQGDRDRWARGNRGRDDYMNSADFYIGRTQPATEADGTPILNPDGTQKLVARFNEEGLATRLQQCVGQCKACIFTENKQINTFKGEITCLTDSEARQDVITKIVNHVMQESATDRDVFAAVTSILDTGTNVDLRQQIRQKVENGIKVDTLAVVRSDVERNQHQTISGKSFNYKFSSQLATTSVIESSLLEQNVAQDILTEDEFDTIIKTLRENNASKTLGEFAGSLIDALGNAFLSTIGIIVMVIIGIVVIGAIIFLAVPGLLGKGGGGGGGKGGGGEGGDDNEG